MARNRQGVSLRRVRAGVGLATGLFALYWLILGLVVGSGFVPAVGSVSWLGVTGYGLLVGLSCGWLSGLQPVS